MKTKSLRNDNKISRRFALLNILSSWRSPPKKNSVLDDFPLPSMPPPPQKRKFYLFCRLAVSEKHYKSTTTYMLCLLAKGLLVTEGCIPCCRNALCQGHSRPTSLLFLSLSGAPGLGTRGCKERVTAAYYSYYGDDPPRASRNNIVSFESCARRCMHNAR